MKKCKVISIISQKGGVGKTTTASTLAAGLALKNYKTLLIDLDSQGSSSYAFAANTSNNTIFEVLKGSLPITEVIQKNDNCDVISANELLSEAEIVIKDTGKEFKLKEALEEIKDIYDFIIIDTPPSLGILTVNALTASDSIIIPTQADILSIRGITQLKQTIEPVKKYCNPNIKISGILLTRYNEKTILSREVTEFVKEIAKMMGTKVFDSTIREAVAVKEAQSRQKSLFISNPKSNVCNDYKRFIDEFLESEG